MGQLVRFAVKLLVTMSVYHGYCQSATSVPESDGVGPRDMRGPTATAQPQTGPPTTESQPQTGPPTDEDDRGWAVARVVSRQRAAMWYWVMLTGGVGLAAITVLSLLTVLVHKLCRRSWAVDMRHKQPAASQLNGAHKHKALAGGHQTAVSGTETSYCNMKLVPAPPTTRVADSMLSWGSEFELAGDLTDNIYSNDYKKPAGDDGKKGRTKPAHQDIYVNGCAL